MEYSFIVTYNENNMKNYFKDASGANIKDTLIISVKNTGSKGWNRFQGYFKCLENKSNLFFENILIPEETYPNGSIELVLTFPRIEKNKTEGKCFTTLQFVYKEVVYNDVTINFIKKYDLLGSKIVQIEEDHVEQDLGGEINYFQPQVEKKEEEEEKDEMSVMIKKFRTCYQFSKLDYPDDYVKEILEKGNFDFQKAMLAHIEKEDQQKELNKNKSKNEKGLCELTEEFRKAYQLSPQDYPDKVIKDALKKKEGNFNNAFEELMSFIK
jgi:hypothetical protein